MSEDMITIQSCIMCMKIANSEQLISQPPDFNNTCKICMHCSLRCEIKQPLTCEITPQPQVRKMIMETMRMISRTFRRKNNHNKH